MLFVWDGAFYNEVANDFTEEPTDGDVKHRDSLFLSSKSALEFEQLKMLKVWQVYRFLICGPFESLGVRWA